VTWEEAVAVLRGWEGRAAVVVPFLLPGISLTPFAGVISLEQPRDGVVRLRLGPQPEPFISLFRATFIEAGWVAGREGRGLSVVQGGTRVDVFLDGS
jgi:hypothetical protein